MYRATDPTDTNQLIRTACFVISLILSLLDIGVLGYWILANAQ